MVTLFGKEYNDVGKDVGKDLSGSLAKVYNLVKQKPTLTIQEIAKITSSAPRTVERSLSKLKSMHLIKRIGSRKEGRWEVSENNKL